MKIWSSGRLVVIMMVMMNYCSSFACGKEDDKDDVDSGTGDESCHLTSQSFYSYMVRIWNNEWKNTSAHGSILAYRAILTTCSPFILRSEEKGPADTRPVKDFTVYGQKVRTIQPEWDEIGRKVCIQERKVAEIRVHPKCSFDWNNDAFYNFAILVIDQPFVFFRQHSYPTLSFPNLLSEMVYLVTLVNVQKNPGCELPIFRYHALIRPSFAHNMRVISMRYLVECVNRICEMPPIVRGSNRFRYPGSFPFLHRFTEAELKKERENVELQCETDRRNKLNYTFLCVYFPHDPLIKVGHEWMDIRPLLWTGGTPLVCNGTAIGHTSTAIDRSEMHDFKQDFYVINTYIRVWPWLVNARIRYGPPWIKPHLLEKEMKERGAYARDGGAQPPVPIESVRSWSDDGNDGLMNRSSKSRQLLGMTFGSILVAIALTVGHIGPTM